MTHVVSPYVWASITQNVISDPLNTYALPLNAGATFTGTKQSTLGVAGIQVMLKADQNCNVFIDQSGNGTDYDVTDQYTYLATEGFGITVQAVGSHYRVRVTNTSSVNQTYLRLETALCPIVEALPRSLSPEGNLRVQVMGNEDSYGFDAENTPSGEIRSVTPVRLVGNTFEGTTIDTQFWVATPTAPGTITQATGRVLLATAPGAGGADGSAKLASFRRARYIGGYAHCYRHQGKTTAGIANNNRRWGVAWGATMPTITDGYFFQWKGTTFQCVTRKANSDVEVPTGSFNGEMGVAWSPGTAMYTFEIYWNTKSVWFVIEDKILHTVMDTDAPIADTYHMHIFMDNVNSGGLTTNVEMHCRSSSIRRLGPLNTQPHYFRVSGNAATHTIKLGPGFLHRIVFNNTAGTSFIMYDQTSAAVPIIATVTTAAAALGSWEYQMPFYNGLVIVTTGNGLDMTVIYE